MKKVIHAALIALGIVGLSTGLMPRQADALSTCATGYFCIWDGYSWSGTTVRISPPGSFSCKNMPYSWADNMANSASNASSRDLYLYDAPNCQGSVGFILGAGVETSTLGDFVNKLSSVKRNDF